MVTPAAANSTWCRLGVSRLFHSLQADLCVISNCKSLQEEMPFRAFGLVLTLIQCIS